MGQWRRAGGNADALVRHDGSEIDKWMFRSAGDSGEERHGYNYWLNRLKR